MGLTLKKYLYLDLAVFLGVLFSRIPFCNAGFGLEPDAWRVAYVANLMRDTFEYHPSRYGANPLHEIGAAFLAPSKAWLLNGSSALMMAFASLALTRIFRRLNYPHAYLAGIYLAAIPLIYVMSTSAKDYTWSLGFALLCLWQIVEGNYKRAGILWGLTVGCRLPMVIFGPIYLGILIKQSRQQGSLKASLSFLLPGGAIALLCFIPPLQNAGLGILSSSEVAVFRPLKQELIRWSYHSFGLTGTISILLIIIASFLFKVQKNEKGNIVFEYFWLGAILLQILVYLYNSNSGIASYTIPISPFLILLCFPKLSQNLARASLGLMIVSALFLGISRQAPERVSTWTLEAKSIYLTPFRGPIIADHQRRASEQEKLNQLLAKLPTLLAEDEVVVGPLLPKLEVLSYGKKLEGAQIHYSFDKLPKDSPGTIYYLPREFKKIQRLTKVTPQKHNAKVLTLP